MGSVHSWSLVSVQMQGLGRPLHLCSWCGEDTAESGLCHSHGAWPGIVSWQGLKQEPLSVEWDLSGCGALWGVRHSVGKGLIQESSLYLPKSSQEWAHATALQMALVLGLVWGVIRAGLRVNEGWWLCAHFIHTSGGQAIISPTFPYCAQQPTTEPWYFAPLKHQSTLNH